MAWASVSPSVCLSYLWAVSKTVEARITKSLLWAASRSLVFRDEISCPWVRGFLLNDGIKEGYSLKDVILPLLACVVWKRLQIGTDMLLIITGTGDRLFRFININDLERPWTPKKRFLVNFSQFFSMQRTFQHWIATKWPEIDQDNLRMKFSALNVDFSCPSIDPL